MRVGEMAREKKGMEYKSFLNSYLDFIGSVGLIKKKL